MKKGETLSVKGQIQNILGFEGHTIPLQLCHRQPEITCRQMGMAVFPHNFTKTDCWPDRICGL